MIYWNNSVVENAGFCFVTAQMGVSNVACSLGLFNIKNIFSIYKSIPMGWLLR